MSAKPSSPSSASLRLCGITAKPPKPRTWRRAFLPRFWDAIREDRKLQTVRALPADGKLPRPGDFIAAYGWSGAAYRSKQVELVTREIVGVQIVTVDGALEFEEPMGVSHVQADWTPNDFGRADGFTGFEEFRDFVQQVHGVPFRGYVTYWRAGAVDASRKGAKAQRKGDK